MLTRIITAVIGIPLVIAVIVLGDPWLRLIMMVISCIGLYEFYSAIKSEYKPMQWLGYIAVIIYYLLFSAMNRHSTVFLSVFILIALTVLVITYSRYTIADIALTVFPIIYVAMFFSFLLLIREAEYGMFWVWLIPLSAWGSDTCAYFAGLTLGKHKLAPQLSPKKTVEGSVGGVIGAALIAYIYTMIYTHFQYGELRSYVLLIIIAATLGAIFSQVGDLAASAIKRHFNVKDFGNLLPGHGGILDRFDSILFVAPTIYIMVMVAQYVMR